MQIRSFYLFIIYVFACLLIYYLLIYLVIHLFILSIHMLLYLTYRVRMDTKMTR